MNKQPPPLSAKISPTKSKSSSFKIQKQKSFIGNSDAVISTEIQYSPRRKSQTEPVNSPHLKPVSPRSPEDVSRSSLLLYCGDEIIAWCRRQSLQHEYNNVKQELCISLENADVICVTGHSIHANTLESPTINKLIDLIKILSHVEDVSIYYISEGADIDECMISRLTSSPRDTEVERFEFK